MQVSSSPQVYAGSDMASNEVDLPTSSDAHSYWASAPSDLVGAISFTTVVGRTGRNLRKTIGSSSTGSSGDLSSTGFYSLHDETTSPKFTMASTRRDQLAVILDILAVADRPVYQKRLLREANLSYAQFGKYLNYLVSTGLLQEQKKEVGKPRLYATTSRGRALTELLTNPLSVGEQLLVSE